MIDIKSKIQAAVDIVSMSVERLPFYELQYLQFQSAAGKSPVVTQINQLCVFDFCEIFFVILDLKHYFNNFQRDVSLLRREK